MDMEQRVLFRAVIEKIFDSEHKDFLLIKDRIISLIRTRLSGKSGSIDRNLSCEGIHVSKNSTIQKAHFKSLNSKIITNIKSDGSINEDDLFRQMGLKSVSEELKFVLGKFHLLWAINWKVHCGLYTNIVTFDRNELQSRSFDELN
jgi:hypothetical protein